MRALALLPAAILLGCAPAGEEHLTYTGTAMGSSVEIQVAGPDRETLQRALDAARVEIDRIDRMMTAWKHGSPLMQVNYAAGKNPVRVPPELFFVIKRSRQISELTGGAFDITFAGAGGLWNWRAPEPRVPAEAEVAKALKNVGWRGMILDEKEQTVFLSRPGMRIGLGAIAPGYAGDMAMRKIRALGVKNAVVNMSGEVLAVGTKGGKPWTVSITHPRRPGESFAAIPVSNLAVATSGDYERFFEIDGRRYCHIIDPRTGYPAAGCRSVTIVTTTLAFADALSTAVFVLGPEKGMELVGRLEGVEAIIVAADGATTASAGLAERAPLAKAGRE